MGRHTALHVWKQHSGQDYEAAIEDLRRAMGQLEPDGAHCAVCGDSSHQAWECHHNPLAARYEFFEAPTRWRCFHCGEVFDDEVMAREHFGPGGHDEDAPACVVHPAEIVAVLQTIVEEAESLPQHGGPEATIIEQAEGLIERLQAAADQEG